MPKTRPWDNCEFLEREFVELRKSTSQIAKEHDTYPMTIRRALKKHGFNPRNKSSAQKNNLEKNGSPLQGRKRPHDEKMKISMGLQQHWENMTAEEVVEARQLRSDIGKTAWLNKTDEEKSKAVKKMRAGNAKKKRAGSKNENAMADLLINVGYNVVQRSKDYTAGRRYEIDIALPKEHIAIEWDGPNHFLPIYGKEALQKVQEKDAVKNNALVKSRWTVIRVRDHSKSCTMAFQRRTADKIIDLIENGDRNVVHIIDAE